MTEWTAKRLDALPEFTGVKLTRGDLRMLVTRRDFEGADWTSDDGAWIDSGPLAAWQEEGWAIEVVSVPIDALRTGKAYIAAVDAYEKAEDDGDELPMALALIAAIAHITGEAS